jgi:hypothetical protein
LTRGVHGPNAGDDLTQSVPIGQWTKVPLYVTLSDGRQVDITTNYKTSDGKYANQLIRQVTLDVLIEALEATKGITSIDISASTNGYHDCTCHREGLALDIDAFNGTYVRDMQSSQLVIDFQKNLAANIFVDQNFGPSYNYLGGHESHVHFSVKGFDY